MKKILIVNFLIVSFLVSLISSRAFAINPQEWLKKMGQQKRTRISNQRGTAVAAVRGVDEPGQVDPNARNFEAVQKMEKRSYPADKVDQFVKDGKLEKAKIGNGGAQ